MFVYLFICVFCLSDAFKCLFVGPPFAPRSVIVTVSGDALEKTFKFSAVGKIVVNWTKPEFDGNTQLTGYEINCRLVGAATWTIMPVSIDKHSETMPCLTAVGDYEIIVFALNHHGRNGSQSRILNFFHPTNSISGKLILTTYKLYLIC